MSRLQADVIHCSEGENKMDMIIDIEYSLLNTDALHHEKLIGLMKDRSDKLYACKPQ